MRKTKKQIEAQLKDIETWIRRYREQLEKEKDKINFEFSRKVAHLQCLKNYRTALNWVLKEDHKWNKK